MHGIFREFEDIIIYPDFLYIMIAMNMMVNNLSIKKENFKDEGK